MTKLERKVARLALGSQAHVAKLLGISKRSIVYYEQRRKAPRMYELALLWLTGEEARKAKP